MISLEEREKIVADRQAGMTIKDLSDHYGYSAAAISRLLRRERETGDIMPQTHLRGRKPTLDDAEMQALRRLFKTRPKITLAEAKKELGLSISVNALSKIINHKLGLRGGQEKPWPPKRPVKEERDALTGILTRATFDALAEIRLTQGQPGTAAMLTLALDNLKYINLVHGHDCGDRYLKDFARSLRYFEGPRALLCRRTGGEFNLFLHGYDSEEEVRELLTGFWRKLEENEATLPGGEKIKFRVSGGLAWYGKDAAGLALLLRLSAFTLYQVERAAKGALWEFDREKHARMAILFEGQEDLSRLLEKRMVRFAIQPIVSVEDGSVYGYEFLMRPTVERFANLRDLLRLAKAEAKLYQLEELTWREAMSRFAFLVRRGRVSPTARAFVNSVSSQILSADLAEELGERYGDLFHRVVIEITEGEEGSGKMSAAKKEWIHARGGLLALDDYGSGYNSGIVLADLVPDIVKVDVNSMRGINLDEPRLSMVRQMVDYAKERGVRILAEGVETSEELETLIALGVDYVQGYYLAYPTFTVPQIPQAVTDQIRVLREKYRSVE